ncbi:tail fiber protein [Schumannella luteola]|uniref:Microcystin-dependent protein n=1 Tax=Schumannella luteola TaxID=472059 RepID=A0A852YA98_9MICO|nr:tail fiber protein [Schumannella luteola]NYG98204.1 microcystin-dependent protein [Schumannella luteola]TPX03239.1 phage tail protein [Schumannella luteola]
MEPFVGEIIAVGFNFAPRGWALCNGQLLPISQNTALFSLLGVNYGGDGKSTFGLPDLRGVSPIGVGQGPGLSPYYSGQAGGAESVTLLTSQMPAHTHTPVAVAAAGDVSSAAGATWAEARSGRAIERGYAPRAAADANLDPSAIGITGGSQPHNNMPPFLTVSFIIALQGIFPQRP